MPDKWDQYSQPGDKWDQYAESSESAMVAGRPGQRATFNIPGQPLESTGGVLGAAGEGEEAQGVGNATVAREHPGLLVNAGIAGLALPEAAESIAAKGFTGWLAPAARTAVKSYVGSEIGGKLGGLFGDTGRKIGEYAGMFTGPFVGGRTFARLPFGVGRMAASTEEYAAELANRKAAQQAADIAAGVRKAPAPPKVPAAPSPSPFGGLLSSSPEATAKLPEPSIGSKIEPNAPPTTTSGRPAEILPKTAKMPPAKKLIVEPGSPEAAAPHVEGSYWSFKEPSLRQAVLSGDRDAAFVYKQRFGELPPGARYVTDVGNRPNRGLYESRK